MTDENTAPTEGAPADVNQSSGQPWWSGKLPDDIAALDDVQNSKDESVFWDQYKNLRSRIGNSVSIPSEDASAEDRQAFIDKLTKKVPDLVVKPGDDPDSQAAFYQMMGRPEAPDKYAAPELEAVDGVEINDEYVDRIRKAAHKSGLSQKQFESLYSDIIGSDIERVSNSIQETEKALSELKSEWGYAFDVNAQRAITAAKNTGAPEHLVEMLEGGTASADMMRYFNGLAKQLGSEPSQLNSMANGNDAIDPDTARERISEIMNNKSHAYWNPADPAHDTAKKKVSDLYRKANPDNKPVSIVGS